MTTSLKASKSVSNRVSKLSCEQVYNVWVTEPDILRLLDLRPVDEFRASHIPGAVNISLAQLPGELLTLHGRLAVMIAPESVEAALSLELGDRPDCVFMSQCHRWAELQKPLVGDHCNSAPFSLKYRQLTNLAGVFMHTQDILFYQFFEAATSTYTYLIADKKTQEAALIDPVLETVDRDLKWIEELGLRLLYVLDTHIHADHITGAGEIRKRTQARTAVSQNAQVACVDIPLEEGQELLLGDKKITVIATPGHTNTCLSYLFEGMVFTGDALLIRGCGRTDFQQGSAERLYHSVHEKLFQLPEETIVYPGHDYRGLTSSTIGLEKRFNPRLGAAISQSDFVKIMGELKLAPPKKIHEAVPANLACGAPKDARILHSQSVDGIPEVSCEDVFNHLPADGSLVEAKKLRLIDVRRPEEFNNELGHIPGAELIPLGPALSAFLEKGNRQEEIVFICRSGGRSGSATAESIQLGYKGTINMAGGMIRWNEKKLPVERQ